MDQPDAMERIAQAMSEDGCSMCVEPDERCCMTDNARRVTIAVMREIERCGFDAGAYVGVLDIFAKRNDIEFERADYWPKIVVR